MAIQNKGRTQDVISTQSSHQRFARVRYLQRTLTAMKKRDMITRDQTTKFVLGPALSSKLGCKESPLPPEPSYTEEESPPAMIEAKEGCANEFSGRVVRCPGGGLIQVRKEGNGPFL